jgi:cytochrome oxidase Cu insertion factor (SCO1/SenC/PrrC family)
VHSPTRHLPRPFSSRITDAPAAARLLLAALAATAPLGCGSSALPVLGTVPPFALTERSGKPFSAAELQGRVWIANFIFTRCPDVCPALTEKMGLLQEILTGPPEPVRLVSFTVDPAHDTPAVLSEYATRRGARDSWFFLTGPRNALAGLLKDGFKVAFADDGPATAPITHSDRFVLVDREMRIRGFYHGSERADLTRLERDAAALRDRRAS